MKLLRYFYNWTLSKAEHKYSSWILSLVSFTESSFFPIPPDILIIPMIIARRTKAWIYAFICTLSSVLGGVIGYAIGYFFFNSIGILIIEYYSLEKLFESFESNYNTYGVWFVLGAGFTPFPFKFITIASGLFQLNLPLFILASLIARGLRFFIVAALLKIFGQFIKRFIDRYFNFLTILFFVLLIGGFVIIKYL